MVDFQTCMSCSENFDRDDENAYMELDGGGNFVWICYNCATTIKVKWRTMDTEPVDGEPAWLQRVVERDMSLWDLLNI